MINKIIPRSTKGCIGDVPFSTTILAYTLTILLAVSMLFPLLIVLTVSFTDQQYILENGYPLIPKHISLEGYQYLMKNIHQIGHAYGVTIFVTVVGVIYGLFFSFCYAYVLSRPTFPWKKAFTFYIFFTMLFSGGLLPTYLINTQYYHLRDSIWALILPGGINVMNIIIMRTYLKTTIPESVIESAKLDGAGELTCLMRIVMPMATPVLATIGLFLTVSYWNEWMRALMYIAKNDKIAPISLIIQRIERNIDFLNNNANSMEVFASEERKKIPVDSFRMALVIVSILPMLLSYPFFQRFFISGLTVGSIKG